MDDNVERSEAGTALLTWSGGVKSSSSATSPLGIPVGEGRENSINSSAEPKTNAPPQDIEGKCKD